MFKNKPELKDFVDFLINNENDIVSIPESRRFQIFSKFQSLVLDGLVNDDIVSYYSPQEIDLLNFVYDIFEKDEVYILEEQL